MIKTSTFDLLDAEFTSEVTDYLSIKDKHRYSISNETFNLDPTYWQDYYKKINDFKCTFSWDEFKLDSRPDLNTLIPTNDIGIYMFIVKPLDLIYDLPKFVIYVGISGEKGSNRPLKDRIGDYLNFNIIKKRSSLHRLLCKYYSQAYVAYSTVNIKWQDVEEMEKAFHGFFMPIGNKRDFPVKIKKIKNSFQ
jgi:hypothetical protein